MIVGEPDREYEEIPQAVQDTQVVRILTDGDGDWKWPRTQYVYRTIEGPLAVRVRQRLGAWEDSEVEIYEQVEVGGYSEWTQESTSRFEIRCSHHHIEFPNSDYWGNPLVSLLTWLDSKPEPRESEQ